MLLSDYWVVGLLESSRNNTLASPGDFLRGENSPTGGEGFSVIPHPGDSQIELNFSKL